MRPYKNTYPGMQPKPISTTSKALEKAMWRKQKGTFDQNCNVVSHSGTEAKTH